MKDLAALTARVIKRAAAEEKERSIPLQKDCRIKVKGKVSPTSYLKIKGKGPFFGAKKQKKENS